MYRWTKSKLFLIVLPLVLSLLSVSGWAQNYQLPLDTAKWNQTIREGAICDSSIIPDSIPVGIWPSTDDTYRCPNRHDPLFWRCTMWYNGSLGGGEGWDHERISGRWNCDTVQYVDTVEARRVWQRVQAEYKSNDTIFRYPCYQIVYYDIVQRDSLVWTKKEVVFK